MENTGNAVANIGEDVEIAEASLNDEDNSDKTDRVKHTASKGKVDESDRAVEEQPEI